MVDEHIEIEVAGAVKSIRVITLERTRQSTRFSWLQYSRQTELSATRQEGLKTQYYAMERFYALQFSQIIAAKIQAIDVIMSPPSRFPEQAAAYRNVLKVTFNLPDSADITGRFKKISALRSSDADATVEGVREAISYSQTGDETEFKTIMIVDEILNTGRTLAATVNRLHEAGMPLHCNVILVAPLWIPA